MRIISVDMMIDDNDWLIDSMVVVGCSKCCDCGDPGCRVYPFYTVRWYAHVLTRLRHGLWRNKYPRLPVLRKWTFELNGGILVPRKYRLRSVQKVLSPVNSLEGQ